MFTEQLLLPLVVIGLVVGTLFLSGLASRHRQHEAARRSIVQSMEAAIRRVEQALDGLAGEGLDRDLRQALRRDVLDRYRMIGEVCTNYPGLAASLQQAETRLNAEDCDRPHQALTPPSEIELHKLIHALDDLRDYLQVEGTLHPLSVRQRELLPEYLGEYAADLLANYYHAKFDLLVGEGKRKEGIALMKQLMALLGDRGPDTDRVRGLYHAARAAIEGDEAVSSMPHSTRQAS